MQFALPWFTAYVPATQSRQALATVAPVVGRYVPALQSSHVVEPLLIAKDPVAQGVHAWASVVQVQRMQSATHGATSRRGSGITRVFGGPLLYTWDRYGYVGPSALPGVGPNQPGGQRAQARELVRAVWLL